MIRNNAILILKTFSDEEVKLFEDFLNSPFHNKNTKVIQLFNVLKKYHPDYNNKRITKENLFEELFGHLKFKESYIRNLFSDLNILAEKFLQYVHATNGNAYEKFLIEELNNRNLEEIMEKKIRLFEKKIDQKKSRDQEYYTNKIFIHDAKSFLSVDKTLWESYRPEQVLNILKLFLLSFMECSFYLVLEEQRVKIKHDYSFLKHSLDFLKNNLDDFKESPLLLTYYYLWLCFFEKNNEECYLKARELFKTHFSSFSKLDKKNIYSVLQTYCINKSEGGAKSYNKELLNILLEMLKFDVVSHKEDDIIHLNLYRNIMLLCISLEEIDILKKFIPEYVNFVSSESRLSITAYSYAHLNYLQRNFEKALGLCNEINFNDLLDTTNENLYFKNDIKKLTLQCLYELNSLESALSHIDAHKHFLNNSKLIKESMRKRNINFLNYTNALIKLKLDFDDFKLTELRKKILHTKELTNSDWLLEKIEEMENETYKIK